MNKHVVLVCGYGCHLVPELRMYLDRVAEYVNRELPEYLILCGGFTQRKSAPGISEAALMKSYILPRLNCTINNVILEEDSYTSPDTVEKVAEKIGFMFWITGTKLTVFCEATRALKVDLLVRHFLGLRPNIETASWELMSPQKQIIATLYDWAAIKSPLLARYFRNKRIRRAEQI